MFIHPGEDLPLWDLLIATRLGCFSSGHWRLHNLKYAFNPSAGGSNIEGRTAGRGMSRFIKKSQTQNWLDARRGIRKPAFKQVLCSTTLRIGFPTRAFHWFFQSGLWVRSKEARKLIFEVDGDDCEDNEKKSENLSGGTRLPSPRSVHEGN